MTSRFAGDDLLMRGRSSPDVREVISCGVNDVRAQSTKYSFVNNRIAVGLLVEQGWRVKRAYPVYDMKRENKAVGLGLFKSLK